MPNRMERFTQRARRVLSLAQEAAERLKQSEIRPEHLLIAMLQNGDGAAERVLASLGLGQLRVEEALLKITSEVPQTESTAPGLSENTKRIIEMAVDEARRRGQEYIGTEHLLLGLLQVEDAVMSNLFKQLALRPDEIRREVERDMQMQSVVARSTLRGDFGRQATASEAAGVFLSQLNSG